MPGNAPRIYLDADVFISFLDQAQAARHEDIDPVLDAGARGDIALFTSTLTIAEVAYITHEKTSGTLDPKAQAAIDNLWFPNSAVKLVEVSAPIARRARELTRLAIDRGERIPKPPDAIHAASAEHVEATKLFTYNVSDFNPMSADIGCTVSEPTGGQQAFNLGTGDVPEKT